MKLRRRLALAFAAATSLTLACAFAITLTSFKHAQERQLDNKLRAHALHDAEAILQMGGSKLELKGRPLPGPPDMDGLVKYRVVYRPDGQRVMVAGHALGPPPTLARFHYRHGMPLPMDQLDFKLDGQQMRGILARIGTAGVLLLAASRSELDADVEHLEELMAGVLLLAVSVSLLLTFWLGGRLTSSIEAVAAVARRVSEGELDARVGRAMVGRDEEVRLLANDLNRMIDRLSALISAGRRFVSNAAHELRSPLAGLRGELELALRRPRPAEELRAAIEEALQDVNRLIALSEDLLQLARTGIHGPASEPPPARLREVVSEAVRASRARAHVGRGVEVKTEVEDVLVRGYGPDLSRMVRNLIDNALDHAPDNTTVRVHGELVSGRVALAVEDQGDGVPEGLRERIFEPFFRGAAERERSGAGLGLAIAREIARGCGGDLRVDPQAGTTRFVATLRQPMKS